MTPFSLDRRRFLKLSAATAGASLIIGINWSCSADSPPVSPTEGGGIRPNAWLRLDPDGSVTVIVAEAEMGQGVYTSLPMMVAEELEVGWEQVRVQHASLDPVYGHQLTGDSKSIRRGWNTLRQAGAIARQLLLEVAAEILSVPADECRAVHGAILHDPSGRAMAYPELLEAAAGRNLPPRAWLKDPAEFTVIGQPLPRTDIPTKLNGNARFGIDVKLPGMLYATITHCPVFGGKAKEVDDSAARAIKGVEDVFAIDEGVVVVASDTWTAFKGKNALDIEWDYGNRTDLSTESIIRTLRGLPPEQGDVALDEGDARNAFETGAKQIEAEYLQHFQAHIPMEPINCTAQFRDDGSLEIWAPTQSPSNAVEAAQRCTQSKVERGVRRVQRKLFGSRDDSIDVHTTFLGGGFGRRLTQDFVTEAVQIAERFDRPVQLVWTREEDVQHDHYHPLTLHRLRGAVDEEGVPVAWEHRIGGTSVHAGGASHPYEIPNTRIVMQDIGAVIPFGPWRAVSPQYNALAVECFFDELARAGNQDPLELRLRLLRGNARLRKVLEIAADHAGWRRVSDLAFFGVAALSFWGSHVAEVVELEQTDSSRLRVKRVTCAVDCGIVVNPDIVKQQMEGSIIFALTAATKSKITVREGRVEQSNFHNYPILRIDETPEIDVVIASNQEDPGGIGEPGVPPLAPALANALLAATGKPVREFPLRLAG